MAALNGLFNKKKLALTRAKLAAWWDGAAYDEEAALAAYEAKLAAAANENVEAEAANVEDELFDELPFEMPPRLSALALIWGDGRVRPGDATAEAMEPARIGVAADGVLAVWGPGLAAPVIAIASKHPGKIEVYEWREETIEALRHEVKQAKLDDRVTVTRIDLEAHVYPPASLDGIYSVDDFAYVGYPPHLAQQVMKSLKPGACAVLEAYVGLKSDALKTAFASSFAEPQIRAHGDVLQFFRDVGLQIEADEDLTDEFLATARAAFKQLGERLAQSGGIEPVTARELAWETEAWRVRLMMLAQRRLERRRFVVRKPAAQAENTNEPAA
ncbi:MAG: hypothetical protein K2P70_19950 [Hyphomonadaceae bacterium]|nr:hypothetical protein [Hyphomonadaceae bacterium]